MVQAFNTHALLPPFMGSPTEFKGVSPYPTTMEYVVSRFASTPQRHAVMAGFLQFRSALRSLGIVNGLQWLDGSLMENKPEPKDIDVVTFFHIDPENFYLLLDNHPELFSSQTTKDQYKVDAYFVNLASPDPFETVREITYYYGLFSHQRSTDRWKGMIEIPLSSLDNDEAARSLLSARFP